MSSKKKHEYETGNRSDKLETLSSSDQPGRSIPLLLISLAGLIISLMSGFQDLSFLKSLCSSACKDTIDIHFMGAPIWLLGTIFYSGAALLALFRQDLSTWIAGPAAGAEAVLVLIMFQLKAPCVFCIANAVVILVLFVTTFRKRLFWQEATLVLVFFVGFFFCLSFENHLWRSSTTNAAEPGAQRDDDSGIAATVGDEVITNQRLDVLLGSKLMETRLDIYRMKRERLDQLIIELILDKEAKKQGKTVDNLVEQIAPASGATVEEAEIDKYMQDNRARLQEYRGSLPDLRQRIGAFLGQQKRSEVIKNYVQALEPQYGVRILVPMPFPPKVNVDIAGAPTLGPPDAPVTVVEFSDYECPACRGTHEVVKQVRAAYGGRVQWIYKEYPLKRHKDAFKAAEASHCAEDQGKFWEYQERLFTAPDLSPDKLVSMAVELGMSQEKFSQCLQDSIHKPLVEKNVRDAVQAGLDRTPSFMINGKVYAGSPSLDTFRGMIDEELRRAGPKPQAFGKAK